MTEKLFWLDPYQTQFTAKVVDQFPVRDGHAIVLDQTCFYATSGGQPNDTGILNSLQVQDVRFEQERLLHIVATPLQRSEVSGTIDWDRRFDHMQQHTGQHILSAAFYGLFGAETSSFHLGEEYCSIELNKPALTRDDVRKAEDLANSVVFGAQTIETFFVDPQKAGDYPLRKKSDLQESLRIVRIAEFDLSPCSGTHVRNSGEVGMIFITGTEKMSQTLKVSFLCGKRILKQYHHDQGLLKDLSRKLTTAPELLSESVSRLQEQLKQLRKEVSQFQEERLKQEAHELHAIARELNGVKCVIAVRDRSYSEMRFMAQRLLEQPSCWGALVSLPDRRAIFFKSPALPLDLRTRFQTFLERCSAKGGGPPHMMEAGGFAVNEELQTVLQDIFAKGDQS